MTRKNDRNLYPSSHHIPSWDNSCDRKTVYWDKRRLHMINEKTGVQWGFQPSLTETGLCDYWIGLRLGISDSESRWIVTILSVKQKQRCWSALQLRIYAKCRFSHDETCIKYCTSINFRWKKETTNFITNRYNLRQVVIVYLVCANADFPSKAQRLCIWVKINDNINKRCINMKRRSIYFTVERG